MRRPKGKVSTISHSFYTMQHDSLQTAESHSHKLNVYLDIELAGDTKDWHRVAAKLPGRTNKDCRKRWVNKVCGCLKKGPWNKHEDESLLDAVDRYGQR